jgi:anti-anti-sigma regulatory factor
MSLFARVKRVELLYDLAVIWIESAEESTSDGRVNLREQLNEMYETYQFEKLLLNLEDLTFCHDVDISGMLSMLKPLGRDNVKVCCPREIVEEILRVMNLDKIWDICKTQQEAIDRFG